MRRWKKFLLIAIFPARTCLYAMLVLSRKIGERILIGDDIVVTVVRVSQGTVRLGVEAPANLSVVREEVILPLEKNNDSESSVANSTKTKKVGRKSTSIQQERSVKRK